MNELIELLKQIQELAGVGIDSLKGAGAGETEGAPAEGGEPAPAEAPEPPARLGAGVNAGPGLSSFHLARRSRLPEPC